MLPGFNSTQLSPGVFGQTPNYSSSPVASSYPPRQAPSREANLQQGYPSSPLDDEEDNSFIAADDDLADDQASAAAAGNSCYSVVEAPAEAAGYGDLSAQEEAEQRSAVKGTGDESATADLEPEKASEDSASLTNKDSGFQVQSPERVSSEPRIMAAEATTPASGAMTAAIKNGVQSAPGGSGILDEYLRRMHFSKGTPLPTPLPAPAPPQGAPAPVSMPRRWTNTNSYPDGESPSLFCSSCSSPMQTARNAVP